MPKKLTDRGIQDRENAIKCGLTPTNDFNKDGRAEWKGNDEAWKRFNNLNK